MKTIIKNILLLTIAFTAAGCFFSACSSDDKDNGGGALPVVRYVRATSAAQSDSLITKAFLGTTIAIIGDNLSNVREIWFNEHVATLNPVYVTNNSILVTIPNEIPMEITDKMRLITKSGGETSFDFKVAVPAPALNSLKCEYVADGDIATIYGDYFLEPEVFFNGNMPAEITEFTKTEIKVIVPAGAKAGPMTVKSLYGSTRSIFSFRDNTIQTPTTIFITNFDGVNPNAENVFDTTNGISGKYVKFEGDASAWGWNNKYLFSYNSANGKPIVTSGSIDSLALRFEAYSHEWHDVPLIFMFSSVNTSVNVDGSEAQAHWKPYLNAGLKSNYVTDGWITVTIPLSDFKYDKTEATDKRMLTLSNLVNFQAMLFGAADAKTHVDLWLDNFRIVKYK